MTLPPLPAPWIVGGTLHAPIEGAFTASQMHAYGEACAAAERTQLLAELRRMHTEAGEAHNYYLVAARQLEAMP